MLYLVHLQIFIEKYDTLWSIEKRQMIREEHMILFTYVFSFLHRSQIVIF
jgi:hypothetical protein